MIGLGTLRWLFDVVSVVAWGHHQNLEGTVFWRRVVESRRRRRRRHHQRLRKAMGLS
jgi:hypothetical protein